MEDYCFSVIKWGVDFEMKVYIDEKIVVEDLKFGFCDVIVMIGFCVWEFNFFIGILDFFGVIFIYEYMKVVL